MHVDAFQSSLCEALLREYSINQDAEKEETNKAKEIRALKAECPASREGPQLLLEGGQRRVGSQLAGAR